MTERLTITTSDGVTLEVRIDSPDAPERLTVFCHPHPLHGGSMNAPLMIGVTQRLIERGHSVLRFNFRGTGQSGGSHDYGEAEQDEHYAVEAIPARHEFLRNNADLIRRILWSGPFLANGAVLASPGYRTGVDNPRPRA